jgi:type I restriction enzyme S subunit
VSWALTRLDAVTLEVRESVDPSVFGDLDVTHWSIPALDSNGRPAVEPASSIGSAKLRLRGGEVLISRLNPRKARVVRLPNVLDGVHLCSGEFVVLWPTAIEPRFLEYLLLSETTRQKLDAGVQSVTRSHQRIRSEQVRQMRIHVPDRAAQRAIADFLDAETARVDTFVSKKRQLVDLLNERIDAEIRQWVGVSNLARTDPETPSALIKRVLHKLARRPERDGQMVTAYRDGQVTARELRRAEGYTDAWTDGAQLQGVARDDVVVHGLDAFSGAVGSSEVDGVCSPINHVCRPVDGGDPVFYGRMLRLLAISGYLALFATSTRERAVDLRNWDLFGRIPVPLVPIEEQWRLGNRIRKLAPLRVAIDQSAVLAVEHRQALITAAITGELELPGVAA